MSLTALFSNSLTPDQAIYLAVYYLTALSTVYLAARFYAKQYTDLPTEHIDETLIVATTYPLTYGYAILSLALIVTLEQSILAVTAAYTADLAWRIGVALYRDFSSPAASESASE